jgi:hypothetical protein
MAKGEIDADLEDIDEAKLLFLFQQVLECIMDDKGVSPFCTMMGKDVMLFEYDDLRYRIEVRNIKQYN